MIFGPFIDFEYFTIEIPIDAEKNYYSMLGFGP